MQQKSDLQQGVVKVQSYDDKKCAPFYWADVPVYNSKSFVHKGSHTSSELGL